MKNSGHFISCDWGTSNFRIRLVEADSLEVIEEYTSEQGIKTLYQQFLLQTAQNQTNFFKNYLFSQIKNLSNWNQAKLIVVAGMASSNIGLLELEYAHVPFTANGADLKYKLISCQNNLDILLISGVKDSLGMMRGEEIQAIGLAKHLKPYQSGILILPGTHSKHIDYQNESFTSLKSFMTGELFELLSSKSILSNSVEASAWSEARKAAFEAGLAIGFKGQMNQNLFAIRAKHLLQNENPKNSFFMLSGMLIGDELSYLQDSNQTVFLAADQPFFDLYQLGLQSILPQPQIVTFSGSDLEKAFLTGQKQILEVYDK